MSGTLTTNPLTGHTCAMHAPYADAVVVAAGRSSRMGGLDKLDAVIAGRTVLEHAVDAVAVPGLVERTIIVVSPERVDDVAGRTWVRARGCEVVAGGTRRQDSVAAGVAPTTARVVLVHDGARPLVPAAVVIAVAEAADRTGAAIPVLPHADALKRVSGDRIVGAADRDGLVRAQTPQGSRRDLLVGALMRHADGPPAADEAELLARDGIPVITVPGDPANLKITHPADLDLVRRTFHAATPTAIGHGWDSHPFGPRDGLRIGGLTVEAAPRLHGHSDGDVVLHALCDALLGAAGLGDLGRLFPAGDPGTAGVDSAVLVREVVARAQRAGVVASQVDLSIRGARPRLGAARLEAMRTRVGELIGLDPERVSVTAATANLAGDEGAGRVISADCLVMVSRS
jgi:2-C-methyl-D-erythritol 4-phosphate cytidylyltransferase/2-C-methyl-D-erythritol 2,4-cyclodiphosphate synthase